MEFQPKQWGLQMKEFWHGTRSEMKKVSWPAKNEVVGTTGIVIAAVIIFGVYLWVCDLAFFQAIDFIFKKFGSA